MTGDSVDKHFTDLINDNLGIAHKVCRTYADDPVDREDLMQEMVYQLWRSYPRFDGRSKFSTWMYSVCLNTAITYRRKIRHRPESLSTSHYQIADEAPDSREDSIAQLYEAIRTLSSINKAIVLLYLEEMSYEEIAALTGLSKSNVGIRLVRIRKELEAKLKPEI